jgi:hypothetical protein
MNYFVKYIIALKFLLFMPFLFLGINLSAQIFSTSWDPAVNMRPGFGYSEIILTVTQTSEDNISVNYNVTLTDVKNDDRGYYENYAKKYYSLSEMGMICSPLNGYKLAFTYKTCKNTVDGSFSLGLGESKTFRIPKTQERKECGFSEFNCIGENMGGSISNSCLSRVEEIKKGKTNVNQSSNLNNQPIINNQSASSSQNNSNGSSYNSSSAGTNSGSSSNGANNSSSNKTSNPTYTVPSAESQMIKLGIDPNKDYTAELITMGTVLLKEMNENRQRRWEQEEKEAERLEKMKAENTATNTKKYVEYYKLNYVDKYFTAAKNGDEEARLILMMKANELREECSYEKNSNYCDENEFLKVIPENENIPENLRSEWNWFVDWLYDLCDSNNVDGLNLRGKFISKESLETYLPDLEKAVSLGSLDAMVILGMYYNQNEKLEGGNDEEKALFWFTKAANSGCPMAAYYLGMIYKYGHTIRPENYSKKTSLYLTYSVKKDDKIAAEWFAKSIAFSKNHKESTFAKHTLILNRISWTSIFDFEMAYYGLGISISHPDAFIQLSKIYFKGQGVEKNETLAKQLEQEGNTLYKFYRDLK